MIKRKIVPALATVCGVGVHVQAQELVTFHWSFSEVEANSTVPATGPLAGNGVVDPGEGARIALTVSFTPAVGSPISYTPPPGSGTGTVAGFGSAIFDLKGGSGTEGTWTSLNRIGKWAIGPLGTPTPNGVTNAAVAQWGINWFAITANPIENIWRVVWTPIAYTPRVVQFAGQKGTSAAGTGVTLFIEYGGDPYNPLYTYKSVPAEFGEIAVPVVPGPGVVPLVALGGLWAAGRRRRC